MERQVTEAPPQSAPPRTPSSAHLMCRTSLWGVAGFLASSYFAWISFRHVSRGEFEWPHDSWTAVTYVVWIVLLVILTFDTRCVRERLFFGILMLNFLVGFGLTLWGTAGPAQVRAARLGTGGLWALAALLSLTTIGRGGSVSSNENGLQAKS